MDADEFRKKMKDEREVRAQRDAAERAVPGERLRREIREAFERQAARPDEEPGPREDEPTRGPEPPG